MDNSLQYDSPAVALDHDQMSYVDYKKEVKARAEQTLETWKADKSEARMVKTLRIGLVLLMENGKKFAESGRVDWAYIHYYLFVFTWYDKVTKEWPQMSAAKRGSLQSFYDENKRRFNQACTLLEDFDKRLEVSFNQRIEQVKKQKEQARKDEQKRLLQELDTYIKLIPQAEVSQRRELYTTEESEWKSLQSSSYTTRPMEIVELSVVPAFEPKVPAINSLLAPAPAPAPIVPSTATGQPANAMSALFSTGGGATAAYPSLAPAHSDPNAPPLPSKWATELLLAPAETDTVAAAQKNSAAVLSKLMDDSKKYEGVQGAGMAETARHQIEQIRLAEAASRAQAEEQKKRQREAEESQRVALEQAQQSADLAAARRVEESRTQQREFEEAQRVESETYVVNCNRDALQIAQNAARVHQDCSNVLDNNGNVQQCHLMTPAGQVHVASWNKALENILRSLATIRSSGVVLSPEGDKRLRDTQGRCDAAKTDLAHAAQLVEIMLERDNLAAQQRPPPSQHPQPPQPYTAPSPYAHPTTAAAVQPAPTPTPTRPPPSRPQQANLLVVNKQAVHAQSLKDTYWTYTAPPSGKQQTRRGLVNLGNTCYLNSTLQALMATSVTVPFLNDTYLQWVNTTNIMGQKGRVANTFARVVGDMHHPAQYPVSPSQFKYAMGVANESFAGQSQQDANEFLQTLLGYMHEDLNLVKKRGPVPEIHGRGKGDDVIAAESLASYNINNRSFVANTFGFVERSTVRCTRCSHRSVSFSVQQSLQLPIEMRQDATLSDCLVKYTEEELLPEGNEWKCDGCGRKVRARKQLSLWDSPNTLVITLSRFRTMGNLADKIRHKVRFGQKLDLSPFISGPPGKHLYELVALVNHDGGIGGGHYTADVKGKFDKKWQFFSDERTHTATGSPDFEKAYCLYFEKIR